MINKNIVTNRLLHFKIIEKEHFNIKWGIIWHILINGDEWVISKYKLLDYNFFNVHFIYLQKFERNLIRLTQLKMESLISKDEVEFFFFIRWQQK
jgi:hypothetical protein